MENKYKDALDWVFKELFINNATPKWDLGALGKRKEKLALNTALLQELVDKATPIKVKGEYFGSNSHVYYCCHCPKCNKDLYDEVEHYCSNCGQKLDWSDK